MKKLMTLSGILILILTVHSARAAGRYQIELIIFAQHMSSTELFEQTQSRISWPDRVVELSAFTDVGSSDRLLNGAYGALSRGVEYRPLMHVAWIQSIDANSLGNAVRVQGANGAIDGFVRIQRGQYIKLIVDLEYQPDAHRYYRLHEKRRIKFDEIHYLDHPKFGIIAKVRPL